MTARVLQFPDADRVRAHADTLDDDAVLDMLGTLGTSTAKATDAEAGAWEALLDQVVARPDLLLRVRVAAVVWAAIDARRNEDL